MPSDAINQPFPIMEANYSIEIVSIPVFPKGCAETRSNEFSTYALYSRRRDRWRWVSQARILPSAITSDFFFIARCARRTSLYVHTPLNINQPPLLSVPRDLLLLSSPPPLFIHYFAHVRRDNRVPPHLIYAHIVFPQRVPGNLRREKSWLRSFFQIFD